MVAVSTLLSAVISKMTVEIGLMSWIALMNAIITWPAVVMLSKAPAILTNTLPWLTANGHLKDPKDITFSCR